MGGLSTAALKTNSRATTHLFAESQGEKSICLMKAIVSNLGTENSVPQGW